MIENILMRHPAVLVRGRTGPSQLALYVVSMLKKLSMLSTFEPPHLNWSSAMFRKRRTDNDEQTTEAGRDYHEVEAS